MKILNDEEIKQIEFSLLCLIDDICKRESIKYSLTGGTLLGAVRHQGFIPWDDDIDIAMPRPEYERFVKYCTDNKNEISMLSAETNSEYGGLNAKVYDPNTLIDDPFSPRGNYKMGVFVDIFPIDGAGDSLADAERVYKSTRYASMIHTAANWGSYARSLTRSVLYEPVRLALYAISRPLNPNKLAVKINKCYSANAFDDSAYAGAFSGSYGLREILPKEIFDTITYRQFEGREFPVFEKYDEYLRNIYGEYMELPPVESRVSRHGFTAYEITPQIVHL